MVLSPQAGYENNIGESPMRLPSLTVAFSSRLLWTPRPRELETNHPESYFLTPFTRPAAQLSTLPKQTPVLLSKDPGNAHSPPLSKAEDPLS